MYERDVNNFNNKVLGLKFNTSFEDTSIREVRRQKIVYAFRGNQLNITFENTNYSCLSC